MKKSLFEKMKRNMTRDEWSPRGIIAALLFGAIIIVFVFFSGYGSGMGGGSATVAQVNSALLSPADLRSEYERLERMYAPMMGGRAMGAEQRQFLQQQALENLINREVMVQGAGRMGLKATDSEVREKILKGFPVFQDNGRFQRDRYEAILQANHLTPVDFESSLRREITMEHLQKVFEAAAAPLVTEIQRDQEERERKLNVEFVKLDAALVGAALKLNDAEFEKMWKNEEFRKKVEAKFQDKKASLGKPEEMKASHILIKVDPNQADSDKAAKAKIEELRKRAQKEDFGKLAAEFSEDTGSKSRKGDLGFFSKGKMVPEFEAAAFSQALNVVGEPVKSAFGYHLIKVTEKKAAVVPSLDTHKKAIAQEVVAEEKVTGAIPQLVAALSKQDQQALQSVVSSLGLKWEETGFFEANAEMATKLGSVAATSAAVGLNENRRLSNLVTDGPTTYILRWKAEKKEALSAQTKLAEQLQRQHADELLASWMEVERKHSKIERNYNALTR